MTTLISPGVDVSVINQDFYVVGNAGSVPLIFIATEAEKTQPDGITPALGTYESGVLRTLTSPKQALELYGVPSYRTSADGNPHHGDCRNEHGLDAVLKALEVANRVYVIRAGVNLNDDINKMKLMWDVKTDDAADYLSVLVTEWLAHKNAVEGLVPGDVGYITEIDGASLRGLIDEALSETFKFYSFNKDAFRRDFLTDHSVAQSGYQDVITDSRNGYVTGSDVTGLVSTSTYTASIVIDGAPAVAVSLTGNNAATYGTLVAALQAVLGVSANVSIVQGRIRIKSASTGATSTVAITDGNLFSSLNLFDRIATAINGTGVRSLTTYDVAYTTIEGGYEGLYNVVTTAGAFTAASAATALVTAATEFSKTKEFKTYTSLGLNDATRRAEIVKSVQAEINNPYSTVRSDSLSYNLVVAPGFHEATDELLRLSQAMNSEVFVIGDTPFDKPATGPNSIVDWAVSPARVVSEDVGYWYGHGLSSNINGATILTTAAASALRTILFSDRNSEGEWIAPAGPSRGGCPHLIEVGYVSGTLGGPTTFVSDWLDTGVRDELYESPKNINPITFLENRGFVVMGQKTSSAVAKSTDRVNVSRLVKYVKRQLRKALFSYTFEPNDYITRRNIKAASDNFLSTLIDRRGVYDFASRCDETNNTSQGIDTNTIYIDIAMKPVKAAEFIYARIALVNNGANIGTGRTASV